MKGLLLLFYLLALAQGALVQLDESNAVSQCTPSSPCDFLSSSIWVGGTAPVNGDDIFA
jgi:hypothetical protein